MGTSLAGARLASARNQTHERQTEDIIGALMSGDHDKVEPGQVQLGTGLEPAGKRSNGLARVVLMDIGHLVIYQVVLR